MNIKCRKCGYIARITVHARGKTLQCPRCEFRFQINPVVTRSTDEQVETPVPRLKPKRTKRKQSKSRKPRWGKLRALGIMIQDRIPILVIACLGISAALFFVSQFSSDSTDSPDQLQTDIGLEPIQYDSSTTEQWFELIRRMYASQNRNPLVRRKAGSASASIGPDPASVHVLLDAVERYDAVEGFEPKNEAEAYEAMADRRIGEVALDVLKKFGPSTAEPALPIIEQGIAHSNIRVRIEALKLLTLVITATEHLSPALSHIIDREASSIEEVRLALRALGRMGPSAVPALARALDHHNVEIQIAAAGGLILQQGNAESVADQLVTAAQNPNGTLRKTALEAIAALGENSSSTHKFLVDSIIEHDDEVLEAPEADTLVRIGPSAIQAIDQILTHPSSAARLRMLRALHTAGLQSSFAVGIVKKCLDPDNPSVSMAAVDVIGRSGKAEDMYPELMEFASESLKSNHNAGLLAASNVVRQFISKQNPSLSDLQVMLIATGSLAKTADPPPVCRWVVQRLGELGPDANSVQPDLKRAKNATAQRSKDVHARARRLLTTTIYDRGRIDKRKTEEAHKQGRELMELANDISRLVADIEKAIAAVQ